MKRHNDEEAFKNFKDALDTFNRYFKDKTYFLELENETKINFEVTRDEFYQLLGFDKQSISAIDNSFYEIFYKKNYNFYLFKFFASVSDKAYAFSGVSKLFDERTINAIQFQNHNRDSEFLALISKGTNETEPPLSFFLFEVHNNKAELIDIDYRSFSQGKTLENNHYLNVIKNLSHTEKVIINEVKGKQKKL